MLPALTLLLFLSSVPQDSATVLGPELIRIRDGLESMLTENIIPFWHPRTLDRENGGYLLNHDAAGRWLGSNDKYLVTQARTVWFLSRLARSRYGSKEHLAAAKHGYEFLRDRMWDPQHGGFFWAVSADGKEPTKPDKHLYGQAFALYALSEYARAARSREALELARRLFGLIDFRAHDLREGGYLESFGRDWIPLPDDHINYMGAPSDLKLMNTHLHLLEAVTTYYRVARDPVARIRLMELILIQSGTVVRKNLGACTDRYRSDWKPLGGTEYERVSYGHDLENVWLLMEASEALGLSDQLHLELYRALFAYSWRHGFDSKEGGFFDSGPFDAPADRRVKTWWVQAECLVSALRMYELTGDETYLEVFSKTYDWIERRQVDRKGGDWHADITTEGTPRGAKSGAWKSPYHNGRAVIECLEILEAMIDEHDKR